jgi:cytochrome P450
MSNSDPTFLGPSAAFSRLIDELPEPLMSVPGAGFIDFDAYPICQQPHELMAEARARFGPVAEIVDNRLGEYEMPNIIGFEPHRRVFIVLGYDAATAMVMAGPEQLTTEGGFAAFAETYGRVLAFVDGPEHRRLRRTFDQYVFGRRPIDARIEELFTPAADFLADRLARKLAGGRPGDIMRDLCLPMVYWPVSGLMGVPRDRFAEFIALVEKANAGPYDPVQAEAGASDLQAFFEGELERRKQCPGDDLVSKLVSVADPQSRLSDGEIVQHARFLLPAGMDTTRHQMAAMIYALMLHPDQYDAIAADPQGLAAPAVEEALRWKPANSVGAFRLAQSDTALAGVEIPKGSYVFLGVGGINRDPQHWSQPERFDIRREDPTPPFSFSAGRHYCIGQGLARRTLQIMLRALVERLPRLRALPTSTPVKFQGLPLAGPIGMRLTAERP